MFEKIRGHTIYTPAIQADSTVIDLGANRGDFAMIMRSRFGCQASLVEANPQLVDELVPLNFPVHHFAVTSKQGTITFHISSNNEGSSVLRLPEESVYGCTLERSISVPAIDIQTLLDKLCIDKVDLLKIDIEGAEVDVLATIPVEVLKRISQISVEFHCDDSFGFGLRQGVDKVIRR